MKQFLFISLLLFSSEWISAQTRSFEFYDYDDVTMEGMSSTQSYFFRVPTDTDLSQSYITLNLAWSETLLMNRSFVTFRLGDVAHRTVSLARLDESIVIPLADAELLDDNFLKLDILTELTIFDDRCRDMLARSLWLNVRKNSEIYLHRTGVIGTVNIVSLLPSVQHIGLPASVGKNDIEAAAWFSSHLNHHYNIPDAEIVNYNQAMLHSNSVIFGEWGKLPQRILEKISNRPLEGEGLLEIIELEHERENQSPLLTRHLIVTGIGTEAYNRAVYTLLDHNQSSSAFGTWLKSRNAVAPFETPRLYRRERLPLVDPDQTPEILQGIGVLQSVHNFSTTDFGFIPANLEFLLSARYKAVAGRQNAFMNIYLNNLLLTNTRLDHGGLLRLSTTIREDLLLPFNELTIEFVFYPASGECEGSVEDFFAQINFHESGFLARGFYRPEILSFYHYSAVAYTPETVIIMDRELTYDFIDVASTIVKHLNDNRRNQMEIYPRVHFTSDFDNRPLPDAPVIGITRQNSSLFNKFSRRNLVTSSDARIISENLNRELFELRDGVNLGIAQVFWENRQPILLISSMGPQPGAGLKAVSENLKQNFGRLNTNAVIAHENEGHFFNINQYTTIVEREAGFDVRDWFLQFGYIILILILLLIVVVYMVLKRSVLAAREQFD
ncbi:MAG: hypothetical protein EA360_08145 [Balneolaceae bacterium]|nr:MAG: hypothetical protein EA360_08145 [Balneolaceae bacterium]